MSRLNNRPRKTLDYKLPKILFKLERSKIALVACIHILVLGITLFKKKNIGYLWL
jgi:hypothetical protein